MCDGSEFRSSWDICLRCASYRGFLRPLIRRRSTMTTATTSRTWMNEPRVVPEIIPSNHRMRRITAMVYNMMILGLDMCGMVLTLP